MQNFIVSCCSYCFEDVLPIFSDTMGVKLSSVSCLSCLLRLLCLSPISLDLSTLCLIFFLSWLFSSSVMIDLSFSISLAFPIQLLVDVIGFDNSFFLRWLICYEWSVFFQSVWLFQLNSLLLSMGLKIPFSCADSFVMSDLSFFNQSGFSSSTFLLLSLALTIPFSVPTTVCFYNYIFPCCK